MQHRSPEDENRFIAQLIAAEDHAFDALVARYHGQLVRLARLFVHDDGTAEEVAQDAWVAVLAGLPRFEGRSSLKTWIFRIVVNIAKTRGVRDQRIVTLGDLLDDTLIDAPRASWTRRADDDLSPERQLLDREAVEVVARALSSLPAAQHAVVVLRDVEGLDAPDVCKILGVTENNLRVLHHRARAKLRKAMQRYAA